MNEYVADNDYTKLLGGKNDLKVHLPTCSGAFDHITRPSPADGVWSVVIELQMLKAPEQATYWTLD